MAIVFSVLTRAKNYLTCGEIVLDILGSTSKFDVIFDDSFCWFNCYGAKLQERQLRDALSTL